MNGTAGASKTSKTDYLRVFSSPDARLRLIVEGDGRVAYAYLQRDGRIVADVWLCNYGPTPASVDGRNRDAMPFLNPERYVTESPTVPEPDGLSCRWEGSVAVLTFQGEPMACLAPGDHPGRSRNAVADGPLAKRWDGRSALDASDPSGSNV